MSASGRRAPAARRSRRVAIEVRAAIALVGTLVKYLAVSAIAPTLVALWYGDPVWPFVIAGLIAFGAGYALEHQRGDVSRVGFREGYLVVALTWLLAAVYGALPYLLSSDPQLDRPVDALFETMSGFTTTGASVLTDIEAVDHSLLFWRQFTQWLGGMGIIVLALAILPKLRVGGRQLMENEMPGPEMEDLAARIRSTAQRLWLLYVGLTVAQIGILTAFGVFGIDERMGLFEAVSAAFATLPTGGFFPDGRSLEEFTAASHWVVTLFMVIAGANFALTYRALVRRQPRQAFRDEELRLYLGIIVAATALIAVELWSAGFANGEAAIRHAAFQVSSIITTTGFASVDFVSWPALTLMILVLLMFVGGSAGSTGGAIKVVRHLLVGRVLRRELHQTVHPELVQPVRFNGKPVDERTLRAIIAFTFLYVGVWIVGTAIVTIDAAIQGPSLSAFDAIAATATTLGNVGPGLGEQGPMGSFAGFSDVSTLTLTGLMWLGRLEVIPIVLVLTRGYWRV
ncbi:MAG: TrkH family potassium uptake protein [Gaiellales bacterium]